MAGRAGSVSYTHLMQAYKPQHTGAAALVLRALKAMGCATKQQLAQATGLSVMAAGTAVEHPVSYTHLS